MYKSRNYQVYEDENTYNSSYIYSFDSLSSADSFFGFLYRTILTKMKRREEEPFHTYRDDNDEKRVTSFHCLCHDKYSCDYFFILVKKPCDESYKIISTESRKYFPKGGWHT